MKWFIVGLLVLVLSGCHKQVGVYCINPVGATGSVGPISIYRDSVGGPPTYQSVPMESVKGAPIFDNNGAMTWCPNGYVVATNPPTSECRREK